MADRPGYRLSIESSVEDALLTIAPRISAPAGAKLRYELVSDKSGTTGQSHTAQSGWVTVDASGSAPLSRLNLGIGAADRYTIVVKVYDGHTLVAEQTFQFQR